MVHDEGVWNVVHGGAGRVVNYGEGHVQDDGHFVAHIRDEHDNPRELLLGLGQSCICWPCII